MATVPARVLTRFVVASLDIGRSFFTEHVKFHRYSESLVMTDLTNAGKRGKKVRELTVLPGTLDRTLADKILKQTSSSILDMTYDQAKAHLEGILQREDHGSLFRISERLLRGIDVEPAGTRLTLENKFPDGSLVNISASPQDFRVKSSTPIVAPNKPAHGFRQDTLYYPLKKQDGALFYAWLKDNLSQAGRMNLLDLKRVWDNLGVRYDHQ